MTRLFVIGANKAGTTSLHSYLDQHPQIFMSRLKEPTWLSRRDLSEGAPVPDGGWGTTIGSEAAYEALFADARPDQVLGESSTSYLPSAWAPGRVAERWPGALAVAVLRNPAERAFSAFAMGRRFGIEPLADFDAAIDAEGTAGYSYLRMGRYATDLERWLAALGPERVRIHLYEDFSADPRAVLADTVDALGLDPFTFDVGERLNTASSGPSSSRPGRVGRAARAVGRAVLPRRTVASVQQARRARARSRLPSLTPESRARIIEIMAPDIAATEAILGRDLTAWRTV